MLTFLVSKGSWDNVFAGGEAHQWWSLFKHHLLTVQENTIPECQKSSRGDRMPVCLNSNLLEIRQRKEGAHPMEERSGDIEEDRDAACHWREKILVAKAQ